MGSPIAHVICASQYAMLGDENVTARTELRIADLSEFIANGELSLDLDRLDVDELYGGSEPLFECRNRQQPTVGRECSDERQRPVERSKLLRLHVKQSDSSWRRPFRFPGKLVPCQELGTIRRHRHHSDSPSGNRFKRRLQFAGNKIPGANIAFEFPAHQLLATLLDVCRLARDSRCIYCFPVRGKKK